MPSATCCSCVIFADAMISFIAVSYCFSVIFSFTRLSSSCFFSSLTLTPSLFVISSTIVIAPAFKSLAKPSLVSSIRPSLDIPSPCSCCANLPSDFTSKSSGSMSSITAALDFTSSFCNNLKNEFISVLFCMCFFAGLTCFNSDPKTVSLISS